MGNDPDQEVPLGRSVRSLLTAALIGVLCIPVTSSADPNPVSVCGGVAPATYTCSSGPQHDQLVALVSHGSTLVTPAFVGRLRSTVTWTNKTQSGVRSYWCDYKNPQDYIDGQNSLLEEPPNCGSTGVFPPDCIDTTPECYVKYSQTCRSSNYRVDTGKGSGPWECSNVGL